MYRGGDVDSLLLCSFSDKVTFIMPLPSFLLPFLIYASWGGLAAEDQEISR